MALPDWISTFIEPLDRLGIVYMVTGSVAAMAYGEPRMTTDVDVVLSLAPGEADPLLDCFPEADFYRPPEEVVRHEINRAARGHFNVIQHATGMKADFYPAGDDPLSAQALERRRRLDVGGTTIVLAPPSTSSCASSSSTARVARTSTCATSPPCSRAGARSTWRGSKPN